VAPPQSLYVRSKCQILSLSIRLFPSKSVPIHQSCHHSETARNPREMAAGRVTRYWPTGIVFVLHNLVLPRAIAVAVAL
jgi:hypothetical protein